MKVKGVRLKLVSLNYFWFDFVCRNLQQTHALFSSILFNKEQLKTKIQQTITGKFGMIEFYDFGQIVINGKRYTTDVIIFPDRIKDGWWRREGHRLSIDDIKEVVQAKPEVLIVGVGFHGYMKVPNEVKEYFASKKIKVIVENTREACKTYNRLAKSKRIIAAFHLTC